MRPSNLVRPSLALLLAAGLSTLATPTGAAHAAASTSTAATPITVTSTEQLAPGVTYGSFEVNTPRGVTVGYLLTADLRGNKVSLDLLRPDAVAQRQVVSAMTNEQGAIAGVNGDFFNNSETHTGVTPTYSSSGPEIADGDELKFAVPNAQRFGPGLAPGTSTRDVFGVGVNGKARVDTLSLDGEVRSRRGTVALSGLNQYALPVDGVGLFTSEWGAASRVRSTCGSDTSRSDPCSTHTYEVTVRGGVVTSVGQIPGAGAIPADTQVLVGREGGADALDDFAVGDRVTVREKMVSAGHPKLDFAVGGAPILRDGEPLAGLDTRTAAVRSSAGVSADGGTVYLVALAGRAPASAGFTIAELADLMVTLGADDAVNLDGGGSSTVAVREPGQAAATARNNPSDGTERAVANGIGIFVGRH
ncbi:phosphodiester glycosidase family protein [Micromonospora sp. STR1_7]|uniref:Phosphodiester glycosidase family protein n=1 Tax=Micromonospora parastrephiae TaxID=2806101 RepID=A0ABS1XNK0_9ACTN|nr:phosphodiester glycosidase family protein [Micromonospora parastrephiae]MBM0230803.1 phosphodiester glycosidase family protein [Micromonospora parastrephiae]